MTREGTAEGGDGVVSADGVARSPPRALGRPRSRTLEASTLACHVLTIPPIAALPWRSASPTASSAAPSAGRRPASSCVGSGRRERGVSRREQARASARIRVRTAARRAHLERRRVLHGLDELLPRRAQLVGARGCPVEGVAHALEPPPPLGVLHLALHAARRRAAAPPDPRGV